MEKYAHTLNIIGRRLRDNPEASIKIVGCNSDRGEEHNRKDLSRSRAEEVKAYLKYIWGIEASRMELEARNRPAVASARKSTLNPRLFSTPSKAPTYQRSATPKKLRSCRKSKPVTNWCAGPLR
jgi:hypothetical protein